MAVTLLLLLCCRLPICCSCAHGLEEEVDSLGDQLEQEQEDKARQLVCFIPISFAVHYPFLSANTCTTSSSTLWQFESV